jgi:2-methylfumaryl-CoA hydratase
MTKNNPGNFFEDFRLGQLITHATPRTVTAGDVSLYTALYGSRFAVQSSDHFARAIGYPGAPVDDLLVFHIVFGKTVPDISLNAVANLGYANCRFLAPVFPGDTLSATSEVIGLRENSNRKTGVVYVRSIGFNAAGVAVLEYVRWVMVRKRDEAATAPEGLLPSLPKTVAAGDIGKGCPPVRTVSYDSALAGSTQRFGDYASGERIDHFNQFTEGQGRFGRRLVYGGHVISLARALSFNGLANAFHIAGINGGRHVAPLFAGDTVFAWSEVIERLELPGRDDVGALRLRLIAAKNRPCADFPDKAGQDYDPAVILDLDYWALMPR